MTSLDKAAETYMKQTQKAIEAKPNYWKHCTPDVVYDADKKTVKVFLKDRDGRASKRTFYTGFLLPESFSEYTLCGDFHYAEGRQKNYPQKALDATKYPVTQLDKARNHLNVDIANDERGRELAAWIKDIEDRVIATMAARENDIKDFPELAEAKKQDAYTPEIGENLLRYPEADAKTHYQGFCKTRQNREKTAREPVGKLSRIIIWTPKAGKALEAAEKSVPILPELKDYLSPQQLKNPWFMWDKRPFVLDRYGDPIDDDTLYKLQAFGKDIGPCFLVLSIPLSPKYNGKPAPLFSMNIASHVQTCLDVASLQKRLEREEEDMFTAKRAPPPSDSAAAATEAGGTQDTQPYGDGDAGEKEGEGDANGNPLPQQQLNPSGMEEDPVADSEGEGSESDLQFSAPRDTVQGVKREAEEDAVPPPGGNPYKKK